MNDLEKNSSLLRHILCIISKPSVNWKWSYSPITLNSGQNWRFFVPCDREILWMMLKSNRAPLHILLYHTKLGASSQSHGWIQAGVTVRKCSIRVKIGNFFTLWPWSSTNDLCLVWPWKIIGHIFDTTLSFVHHFEAIGELKLELQSGNPQFGSNSAIFCPVWPWNLTDDLEKHQDTSSTLL